ncbi:chromate efflux transporter [Solibacillus sp. FSL H8-0538]|uniref:chromate efflux transporter n=1 Tax=Solibacillus sp. FSL H8-0538 TaxID=2921400 RepID=UPI0030F90E4F
MKNLLEIFWVSLKLGCTSFGGPTAHLGYFQNEYVKKRKWVTDAQYADLVALSQFLPGPASSQVGMGIGLLRGGIIGSIVSFLGFTMPSVVVLIVFAMLLMSDSFDFSWVQGLKLVAVAIVAQAILDLSKKLLPTWKHYTLAGIALIALLLLKSPFTQIAVIVIAAVLGYLLFKGTVGPLTNIAVPISKKLGGFLLCLFFLLLIGLPFITNTTNYYWLDLFEKFYTAGALVFGGGHVVLPLLETQFVTSGILSASEFLAGYGLTQAVPGPLFTFAAYIGTVTNGPLGGLFATFAIFLPAFLLILGAFPFWYEMSRNPKLRGAVIGMNAAVVGILAAAFVTPILSETIHNGQDFLFACLLFLLLVRFKQPPWIIVLCGLIIGIVVY